MSLENVLGNILEMNGESYRLRQGKRRRRSPSSDVSQPQPD
jgi:hypothetical protein